MNEVNIETNSLEHTCNIFAPVRNEKDASVLADRINKLPYLKVEERKVRMPLAIIMCRYFIGFSIDELQDDLDTMRDIIDIPAL